jgi:hypothetical protein
MRIAQIAPLAESVPPKLYGGTERVVAWLTDELLELGHQVTLFASGDSKTNARLIAAWPQAIRLGRPGQIRSLRARRCWSLWPSMRPNSTSSTRISIGCICRCSAALMSRS